MIAGSDSAPPEPAAPALPPRPARRQTAGGANPEALAAGGSSSSGGSGGQYAPLQLEEDRDFDDRAFAEAQMRIEAMTVRRYTRWLVTGYGPLAAFALFATTMLGAVICGTLWGPTGVAGAPIFGERFLRWLAAITVSVMSSFGAIFAFYWFDAVRPSFRSLFSGITSGLVLWVSIKYQDSLELVGLAFVIWVVGIWVMWIRVARSTHLE